MSEDRKRNLSSTEQNSSCKRICADPDRDYPDVIKESQPGSELRETTDEMEKISLNQNDSEKSQLIQDEAALDSQKSNMDSQVSEQEKVASVKPKSRKYAPSVSDSVFSDGTVLRSVSECEGEEWDDDPLEEYETQYFGFTPKSFMNGVYNALAEYIRESLAALTEYIKQQYPEEMTADQLKNGEEAIVKYVLGKLNRSFDLLEQYMMTNILKIPDHVILPEDQVQAENQYTEEDDKKVDMEIKKLQDKILTIRYANGVLRQDIVEMEEMQGVFDNSLKQLETIEELTKQCAVSDIRDNTIYAVNQVKEMIGIVQSLQQAK